MPTIWGWEYRTQRDEAVRLDHHALDGMRLPRSHPLWERYMPPWDWGCRCFLVPIYEGDARAQIRLPRYQPRIPGDFSLSRMTRRSTRRVTSIIGARMIPARDVVIRSPVTVAFTESQPGVYRKELIYPGTFIKKDEEGRPEFRLVVDEKLIDHWVDTFDRMKKNGVDVPVPIEHSEDPEDRRGTVVALKKEFNEERGQPSLYAYVTFRKGDEKLAEHSQVSLYAPPDMEDGVENTYIRPITHVAITDYPLVPGLSRWSKAAAASRKRNRNRRKAQAGRSLTNRPFNGAASRKRRAVSLADDAQAAVDVMDVADAIGIEFEEDAKPQEILALIEDTVQELADQVEELGGELPEGLTPDEDAKVDEFAEEEGSEERLEEVSEDPISSDEDLEDVTISSEELEEIDAINSGELVPSEDEEEEEAPASRKPAPASRRRLSRVARPVRAAAASRERGSISNDVASQLLEARKTIIQGLVAERKITPAAASRLLKIYADPTKITAAASRGKGDDFTSVVAALSENAPAFRTGSRTGSQHQSSSTEKTPLVRDAEARASRVSSKK